MLDEEKLYDILGELLYVVAKADGVIQDSEREALKTLLQDHKFGKEIAWSFKYEESKENTVEETYSKIIASCHRIGPSPLYAEFIDAMNTIAEASEGIVEDESKVIKSFSHDLIERFKKDMKL